MQKQLFLPTIFVALSSMPSYSQSIAESEGFFTITPSFVSSYMDRGTLQSGISFQPTIEYSKGPLTFGFSGSFPSTEKIPETADPEIDIYSSYTWSVVPDVFTIEMALVLNSFPRAHEIEGSYKHTFEPYISVNYSISDLTFSSNLFYDTTMDAVTYEFGVDYTIPFEQLGFDIELSALGGRNDCARSENTLRKVRNHGNYYQAGISVPYEFSENKKLVVGWYYEKGTKNYFQEDDQPREPNPYAIGRGVFNVGFSYKF